MNTSWPLGRAVFTEHLNEVFSDIAWRYFCTHRGITQICLRFPVPAKLSLSGTCYRKDKSFICKIKSFKALFSFVFFMQLITWVAYMHIFAQPRMTWLVISVISHPIYAHIRHCCKLDVHYLYTLKNVGLNNDSPSKTKFMMLKSDTQIFALWQWSLQEAAKNPVSLVRQINLFIAKSK